jgi:hypothetical protein
MNAKTPKRRQWSASTYLRPLLRAWEGERPREPERTPSDRTQMIVERTSLLPVREVLECARFAPLLVGRPPVPSTPDRDLAS